MKEGFMTEAHHMTRYKEYDDVGAGPPRVDAWARLTSLPASCAHGALLPPSTGQLLLHTAAHLPGVKASCLNKVPTSAQYNPSDSLAAGDHKIWQVGCPPLSPPDDSRKSRQRWTMWVTSNSWPCLSPMLISRGKNSWGKLPPIAVNISKLPHLKQNIPFLPHSLTVQSDISAKNSEVMVRTSSYNWSPCASFAPSI